MVVKSKAGSHGSHRKTLIVVSLIVTIVLFSSLFVYWFWGVGDGSMRVKNAVELRDAVNNAEVSVPTTVTLTKDISLGTLFIPAGADITLVSAGDNGFFKLIGSSGVSVITVQSGGRLTLNGVIVTHVAGSTGNGVVVESGGAFTMVDGEISCNTASYGGGVCNSGVFEMYGGVISENGASNVDDSQGGGVYNDGAFTMSGGSIIGNTAGNGGGVSSYGSFVLSVGVISNNQASNCGGGVNCASSPIFRMSGGEISGNTAISGGGVSVIVGSFVLSGGVISNNQATTGWGGGVYNYYGTFTRTGGEISGNAGAVGNDVHERLGNSTSPV
jgi:hypothetical protein